MTHDVADQDAPSLGGQREDVVEVAADECAAAARLTAGRDGETGNDRELRWEQAFLQRGGQLAARSEQIAGSLAGSSIEQVRRRHIGEYLRPDQISGRKLDRFLRVKLQSSQLAIIQPQREAVNRAEAGLCCSRGEPGECGVLRQIADRHVPPSPIGLQARPFLQLHLQGFDAKDHVVGGSNEMMLGVAVHQ